MSQSPITFWESLYILIAFDWWSCIILVIIRSCWVILFHHSMEPIQTTPRQVGHVSTICGSSGKASRGYVFGHRCICDEHRWLRGAAVWVGHIGPRAQRGGECIQCRRPGPRGPHSKADERSKNLLHIYIRSHSHCHRIFLWDSFREVMVGDNLAGPSYWLIGWSYLGFEDSGGGIPDNVHYLSMTCPIYSSSTVSAEIQSQVLHPSSTFGGNTSTECGLERESQQLRERP